MKVAIVGATGLVGNAMLKILEERNFKVTEFIPVASEKSIGKSVFYKNVEYKVVSAQAALNKHPDIALFSAGGATSLQLAPLFSQIGCRVIDNSSAWRMQEDIKLIVPEVNGETLSQNDFIIANPNCSTIQMVMVLNPLHKKYGIKRVVVSTYQAVSGTGNKGIDALMQERKGQTGTGVYPHKIDLNVIPHIDSFLENGYTKEEMKMSNETCKIMGDTNIKVSATTVRVPVIYGHSESVNIEFYNDFVEADIRVLLNNSAGVQVVDNIATNEYPMPEIAAGKDTVFVGRIRRDYSQPKTLNCWIVADNLRKGAATNAIQIAEIVYAKGWVK